VRERHSPDTKRRRSIALVAIAGLVPLLFAPSCVFTRAGGAPTTEPTAEETPAPIDSAAARPSAETPPPAAPAAPPVSPAAVPAPPAPVKETEKPPPSFSVGLSDEERASLRGEAVRELAEADLLISRLSAEPLAPADREAIRTAEEMLRSAREAYGHNDLAAAVGLAKKARLLAAGVSESIRRRE